MDESIAYNLSEILFNNINEGRGNKVAIYYNDTGTTFGQLADQANRIGNVFKNLNIPSKSLIMIMMNDSPLFPAIFFGGAKAGYVMTIANPNMKAEEYELLLTSNHIKAIVIDHSLYFKIKGIRSKCPELEKVIIVGHEVSDTCNLDKLMQEASTDLSIASTSEDDLGFVLYSSGSTGHPKSVAHLHKDMRYTFNTYGKHILKIQEQDIVLSVSKHFFAYGFGNSLTFPFSAGATLILSPQLLSTEIIFDLIEKYKPSIFFGVPSFYHAMLNDPNAKNRNLSSLRLCISAGEPLPKKIFQDWLKLFNQEIIDGIGSTEMLHIYISNIPGKIHPNSTGLPVPGYDIKLIDEENHEVKKGDSGTMLVRGDSSAPFYLNDPQKTEFTMRNGWIYTNDRFHQDDEGYYHYDGRNDDMFKIAGQWFSPVEVEEVLLHHPMIRECLVMGIKDEANVLKIKVIIVLNPEFSATEKLPNELKKFLKLHLSPYKIPEEFLFVNEIPKTSTGKKKRFST